MNKNQYNVFPKKVNFKFLFLICLTFATFLVNSTPAQAQVWVQGQVFVPGPNVPMHNAHVQLCDAGGCLNDATGPDGMYHFVAHFGPQQLIINGKPFNVDIPNVQSFNIQPLPGQ